MKSFDTCIDELQLNDWIWRTPVTDMLNLDENKVDYKKKLFEKLKIRSTHEMGEMKRVQEQRVERKS